MGALILAFLMASTAVSCDSSPSAGTGDTVSEESSSSDSALTTEVSEYQPSGKNYNGGTFTILDYHTENYSWQASKYSDITCFEENGEPINDALYQRNRKVEEELNVNLETVTGTDTANDLIKYVLAGDKTVDAAIVFSSKLQSVLGDTGYLVSLNTIPSLNTSASWWSQNCVDNFTLNGDLKVITGDVSYYTTISPFLAAFNKKMIESYKLENPYDMVRNGKWTFDEYIRMSKAVARDVNGDTKMDEQDIFGTTMQRNLLPYMMRSGGVRLTGKNADGGLDFVLNSERTVDVFEKLMAFIYSTDVVHLDSLFSKNYGNVYFECQMPMFKSDQIMFYYAQLLTLFELRSMDADFGILPTPKYDEKQADYVTSISQSWSTKLCVPQTNDRLEMTGYILDALGYYSQQIVTPAVIDTTVKNKGIRDNDSAEMLQIVLDSIDYDVAEVYNWGNIYSFLTTMANNNDTNFASNYASIEKAAKEALAKTFG